MKNIESNNAHEQTNNIQEDLTTLQHDIQRIHQAETINQNIEPGLDTQACAANFDKMKEYFEQFPGAKKKPDGSITIIHEGSFQSEIPQNSGELSYIIKTGNILTNQIPKGHFKIKMKITFKTNPDGSFTITEIPNDPSQTTSGYKCVNNFKKLNNGDIQLTRTMDTDFNKTTIGTSTITAIYTSSGRLTKYDIHDNSFEMHVTIDNNGNTIAKGKEFYSSFSFNDWLILNYTRDSQGNYTEEKHWEN